VDSIKKGENCTAHLREISDSVMSGQKRKGKKSRGIKVRAAEASGKGKRGQSISAARCKNAKEVGHGAGDEKVAADEPADEEGAEGKEPKGQEHVDTLPMPAAFNNSNYADRMSTGFLSPAHLARTAHAFYPPRGPLLFVKRLTKAGPLAGPVLFIPLFSSSSSSSFYFFFLFFFSVVFPN
jgi:hypothetical protein